MGKLWQRLTVLERVAFIVSLVASGMGAVSLISNDNQWNLASSLCLLAWALTIGVAMLAPKKNKTK